ncbi:MAG: DNA-3-methyladenine glycosylase 2 family protein [Candidatus Dormibacteraeota bacterium]|nr:DNA-3-methyladenine glycosylase 2 family protein [Candidatus Dormibacteraeota bacterium]
MAGASTSRQIAEGVARLEARDPVIARLHAEAGLPVLRPPAGTPFEALVLSITYQQLAGAAASAIHRRLVDVLEGEVTPERMLAAPATELRAAGLSTRKVESLRDLATKVADGTVHLDSRRLARESDDEIVERLSSVRGIGRWSAEMFLLFQLRRLDVWPVGDLAVRHGYGLAWEIPTPTPRRLQELGEVYHPYRSLVAWYCWRAAQLYGRAQRSAVTA